MDDIFAVLRRDHDQVKDLLKRLVNGGPDIHDLAQELERVWPRLRDVLSTEEQIELGDSVDKGKRVGPMQPHPDSAR